MRHKRARRAGGLATLALLACALTAEPAFAVGEPTPTAGPTISGVARWGDTLALDNHGSYSLVLGYSINGYRYQWQRCNAAVTLCSNIAGATGPFHNLTAADVGSRIRLLEGARAVAVVLQSDYGPYGASAATATVVPNPPDNLARPTFSGTARNGETLTRTSPGSWNSPTPTSYAPAWLRCTAAGNDCAAIAGATENNYALNAADVGQTIRLRIAAIGPFGTGFADSLPSAVVVKSSSPPPPTPTPTPPGPGVPTPTTPTKLKPFPKIIVAGMLKGGGVVISDFVIKGQKNVTVRVRCSGLGCPYSRRTIRMRKRRIHIRSLERAFFAGAKIEVRIVKKGRIGKYTRIRIRAGKAPTRVDRCLDPGVTKPRRCS